MTSLLMISNTLAHEIGHWYHSHVLKNLVIAQVHLFILFYLFAQVITFAPLYKSFGFHGPPFPILIGFVLFQMIYSPAEAVMGFLMNVLSRAFEFQVMIGLRMGLKTVLNGALT